MYATRERSWCVHQYGKRLIAVGFDSLPPFKIFKPQFNTYTMDKPQQVKDLMLLEIGDSVERAMEAMKSMSIYEDLKQDRDRAEAEAELLQSTVLELKSKVQGQYDDIKMLEDEVADLKVQRDKARLDKVCAPTMPVIPKAVAIAIFREGVQHGVEAACTELEGQSIRIEESEYVGDFHVTFERRIDLDDELDLDWMRGKCGDYSEETAIEALGTLCATEKFECRIHGIDDEQTKDND